MCKYVHLCNVLLIYIARSEMEEKSKRNELFEASVQVTAVFGFYFLLFVVLEKQVIVIHKWVMLTKQFSYPQSTYTYCLQIIAFITEL